MRVAMCFCWIFIFLPQVTFGEENICDRAARLAATEIRVPLDILMSLTRTETGRLRDGQLEPWPWAVNMEGQGHWFANKEAAQSFVFRQFKTGARNFDVGCFQLNYRWHGDAFSSIEAMFDPRKNAMYAAKFLLSQKSSTGTWLEAAGAYHSKTPQYANAYKNRFLEVHSATREHQAIPPKIANRIPSPLLPTTNERGRLGSLVSLSESHVRPLFVDGERG